MTSQVQGCDRSTMPTSRDSERKISGPRWHCGGIGSTTSGPSSLQATNQTSDHFGHAFEILSEGGLKLITDQAALAADLEQWHALLNRCACDRKEMFAVRLCKTPVALSDVSGDRQRRPVELIRQEAVPSREPSRQGSNSLGEVHCLLINLRFSNMKANSSPCGEASR